MATKHVCPPWMGYLLTSPVRALLHPPQAILTPYVTEDMCVLDIGCAMGYFSLPLARLVGDNGRIFCVDIQKPMLQKLTHRARKQGLRERITPHACPPHSLALTQQNNTMDFALAFAVIHEMPDHNTLFNELFDLMKPHAKCLISEPKGHVSQDTFHAIIAVAENCGFDALHQPPIRGMRSVLLRRAAPPEGLGGMDE